MHRKRLAQDKELMKLLYRETERLLIKPCGQMRVEWERQEGVTGQHETFWLPQL